MRRIVIGDTEYEVEYNEMADELRAYRIFYDKFGMRYRELIARNEQAEYYLNYKGGE